MTAAPSGFTLPDRQGPRPRTDQAVPHLQKTQKSPEHLRNGLIKWAAAALPDVTEEDTRISVSATRALWLSEEVPAPHDDAFMPPAGSREFAHVHADGSMHLCVSDEAVLEIVERGWGEPHPLKDKGVNEVLFYAPRDSEEFDLAKFALGEAWSYATGQPNPVSAP